MGIRRDDKVVEVTLSLSTSIYAAGDVLAATQEIAGAVLANGASELESIVLLDKDAQGVAVDLVFLRSNVSIGTENAAVSVSDANAAEIVGAVVIATGDYVDLVNSKLATKANVGIMMEPTTGTSLYVAAITRGGTPTYTAAGIVLKLGFIRY